MDSPTVKGAVKYVDIIAISLVNSIHMISYVRVPVGCGLPITHFNMQLHA